jgi:hypothetical protein
MLTAPLQLDGSFAAKNVVLYDTSKIFYSLNNSKLTSTSKVHMSNDFFKVDANKIIPSEEILIDTNGLAKFQELIEEQKRVDLLKQKSTLKEVTVYAKEKTRLKQLDQKYAQGVFSGESAAAFDMGTIQNASHSQSIFTPNRQSTWISDWKLNGRLSN